MASAEEPSDLQGKLEQAEAALQRCEKMALAGRYAGAIIHEVNNPLAAITNLVFLTKIQADDPEKVREHMSVVEEQLAILASVTRKVLAFQREQPFSKDFDLIDIMESALKLHDVRLTSGNVALTRDFRQPATASVFGTEILQIVSNLLLNSLDALPKRNAQLRIRIQTVRDSVHITISDNGSGMTPEVLKHLYEPYKTTKEAGTGLGLWLSRQIVDKHKGKLRVRSSQTKGREGTTFRLSVPIKSAA
jgi:C4-dicarboxylate-specific signal transduction histidine kinase